MFLLMVGGVGGVGVVGGIEILVLVNYYKDYFWYLIRWLYRVVKRNLFLYVLIVSWFLMDWSVLKLFILNIKLFVGVFVIVVSFFLFICLVSLLLLVLFL